MRLRQLLLLPLLASVASFAAEERPLPLPNPGFEEGLAHWETNEPEPISALSNEQAATGTHSLKILDADDKRGSWIGSDRVPLKGPAVLDIRGKIFPVSGGGLGIYLRQYDAEGACISGESHITGLSGSGKKWRDFARTAYILEATKTVELLFHSYNAAKVEAYLDDLALIVVALNPEPPWPGTYKLTANDTDKLTAADVVGPDGIVYPNWTRCGVQGGIPNVPETVQVRDFGAIPDDERDDADALDKACSQAGEGGGGAVVLEAGVYHLDRPVTVRHNGVVIRGQGSDRTRIVFRYGLPDSQIVFYSPKSGAAIGPETRIEVHALPRGLQELTISLGDTILRTWNRGRHSGNSFSVSCRPRNALKNASPGPAKLTAVACYPDGETRRAEIPVVVDPQLTASPPPPNSTSAIMFAGRGYVGPRILLSEDGKRGSTAISLTSTEGLKAGDRVLIRGPATKRWKDLTRNKCKWGSYREYIVAITEVVGNRVSIEQPLRLEFPVIDGSFVQKLDMIERCGVEDIAIEQTENLWINTATFQYGWNCWARNVHVKMTGRFPIHASRAKWCEIRNCVFDDAWFKGGGGTAYAGWQHSFDCLIDGLETFNYRHAPLFQWATSGCVIRNGVFHNSDGQWHAGWTNENLMENCVITSKKGHGSYGFGMWASPPEDTAHGPNGPRNVVYNCDVHSEKAGLWMGGMNENWLILHSRFVVEKGMGIFAKAASFDHIIRNNVFVLKDGKSPAVSLATPDCVGIEITGNRLYGGSGKFATGTRKPHVNEDNECLPLPADLPPRPTTTVPSIYEWQQKHLPRPGK